MKSKVKLRILFFSQVKLRILSKVKLRISNRCSNFATFLSQILENVSGKYHLSECIIYPNEVTTEKKSESIIYPRYHFTELWLYCVCTISRFNNNCTISPRSTPWCSNIDRIPKESAGWSAVPSVLECSKDFLDRIKWLCVTPDRKGPGDRPKPSVNLH